MELHLQYLTDDHGSRTAVQIPIREWQELAAEYRYLQQFGTLKESLAKAIGEIGKLRQNEKRPATLDEFLNER